MTNHEQVDTAPAKCVACGKRLDVGEVHCWTCEERRRSPSPAHGGTSAMEEKLRELEAKATPGPWKLWNGWGPHTDSLMRVERIGPDGDGGIQPSNGGDMMGRREDLEIVCQMRNALPALLARLAALTRELHEARVDEALARSQTQDYIKQRDAARDRAEKARGEAVAVVETFLHHQRKLMADSATNETRDQAYHGVIVLSSIMDKLRALAHDEGRGTP